MEISNLFNRLEKVAFHFYGILGGNATGAKKIEKIQKRSGGGDVRGSVLGCGQSRGERRRILNSSISRT
jgi:hypothetical protein